MPLLLDNYNWQNALLWGNSIGHFQQCWHNTGPSGDKNLLNMHLIIAVVEAIPVIGQVVSVAEMFFAQAFNTIPCIIIDTQDPKGFRLDPIPLAKLENIKDFSIENIIVSTSIHANSKPEVVDSFFSQFRTFLRDQHIDFMLVEDLLDKMNDLLEKQELPLFHPVEFSLINHNGLISLRYQEQIIGCFQLPPSDI